MANVLGKAAALVLLAWAAAAAERPIVVSEAWSRAVPPGARSAGAFMTVDNTGGEADRLTGARSDAARTVEIHETRMVGDVMQMRHTDTIAVAPGARTELKPGGFHVMLIDLARRLEPGDRFTVTLVFEKAGEIPVEVEVRGAGPPAAHAPAK